MGSRNSGTSLSGGNPSVWSKNRLGSNPRTSRVSPRELGASNRSRAAPSTSPSPETAPRRPMTELRRVALCILAVLLYLSCDVLCFDRLQHVWHYTIIMIVIIMITAILSDSSQALCVPAPQREPASERTTFRVYGLGFNTYVCMYVYIYIYIYTHIIYIYGTHAAAAYRQMLWQKWQYRDLLSASWSQGLHWSRVWNQGRVERFTRMRLLAGMPCHLDSEHRCEHCQGQRSWLWAASHAYRSSALTEYAITVWHRNRQCRCSNTQLPTYSPYSTPLWNRFGAVFGCVCRLRREIFISQNRPKG